MPRERRTVLFAIDRTLEWKRVYSLIMTAAGADVGNVGFIFQAQPTKSRVFEPPKTWLSDYYQAVESDMPERQKVLTAEPPIDNVGKVFSQCKTKPTGELASQGGQAMGPEQKAQKTGEILIRAFTQCGCQADPNEVKALMWAIAGRYSSPPPLYGFTAALAPSRSPNVPERTADASAGRVVSIPGHVPWVEAWTQVRDASKVGKPVSFQIGSVFDRDGGTGERPLGR